MPIKPDYKRNLTNVVEADESDSSNEDDKKDTADQEFLGVKCEVPNEELMSFNE